MEDRYYKELLMAKLERCAKDEASLIFITTLLTAGGSASESDSPSFYEYKTLFGDLEFKEIKKSLIQEGVVLEEKDQFCLNLGISPLKWSYVSPEEIKEREQLLNELCAYLFQKGWPYYKKVIGKIIAIPEGKYILQELAKVGADIDEASIRHLSRAVGFKYFDEIRKMLEKAGLFVHRFSSKRHDYYRIFPPLLSLFKKTPNLENALTFVYISQNIRGYGCGVLKYDVERHGYKKEIELLEILKEVKKTNWYNLQGFVTTPEGAHVASNIIHKRLEEAKPELEKLLKDIPSKLLLWIWKEVFARNNEDDAYYTYFEQFGRIDSSFGRFLCLLQEKQIKQVRDKVFETLISKGLATKVSSYVSTRGGELREVAYVISNEVRDFFREALRKRRIRVQDAIFPEKLEIFHKIWHLVGPYAEGIKYSEPIKIEKVSLFNLAKEAGLSIENLKQDLEKKGLIQDKGTYWIADKIEEFLREWKRRFFHPLIEYLFHEEKDKEDKVLKEEIKEAEEIKAEEVAKGEKEGLYVLLGKVEKKSYFWTPLEEINPHLLIIGSSGAGKTQTVKAIIYHLKKQGIPAFVIDFANEYKESDLIGYILNPGGRGNKERPEIAITINPLDIPQFEGDPKVIKFRVSGILRKIYGLGDQQEALLRQAISLSYRRAGILEEDPQTWKRKAPPFVFIKEFLEEIAQQKGSDANRAKAILNRLDPIFELKVFANETRVPFEKIYEKGASLFLKNMPTEETKLATAEFFLRWLWHHILSLGEIRQTLRLVIVLDEAHKLAYEGSPVADFLRQGRKYGLSCILSTQQPDDFESKELVFQNTSVQMAFRCVGERHARIMARQIDPGNQGNLFLKIHRLPKLEAIVYSSTKGDVEKVKIIPYFELLGPRR